MQPSLIYIYTYVMYIYTYITYNPICIYHPSCMNEAYSRRFMSARLRFAAWQATRWRLARRLRPGMRGRIVDGWLPPTFKKGNVSAYQCTATCVPCIYQYT